MLHECSLEPEWANAQSKSLITFSAAGRRKAPLLRSTADALEALAGSSGRGGVGSFDGIRESRGGDVLREPRAGACAVVTGAVTGAPWIHLLRLPILPPVGLSPMLSR